MNVNEKHLSIPIGGRAYCGAVATDTNMATGDAVTCPECASRVAYDAEIAIRKEAMDKLREEMKARRITQSKIASRVGNSSGFVGQMLRGGYPYYGAYLLSKKVRVAIEDSGFTVPECIRTF